MSIPLPGRRRAFRFVNGALVSPTTPLNAVTPIITTPVGTGPLSDIVLVNINTALANVKIPTTPRFTIELSSNANSYDGVLVDIEAWQNNVKKAQAYVTGKSIRRSQSTFVEIEMPGLTEGVYDLTVFLFRDPAPGSYAFGEKLYEATNVKQFTLAPADIYVPNATNPTNYYKAPQQVNQYVSSNPSLAVIADQPQAVWLGNEWIADIQATATQMRTAAAGKRLLLAIYSIPNRDNGSYSAGGLPSVAAYKAWIDKLYLGVGTAACDYILEPDALGHLNDLTSSNRADRIDMLRYAVTKLRSNVNARVYLDMGHWLAPATAAGFLNECNPGNLNGFSLNVSNYKTLAEMNTLAANIRAFTSPTLNYVVDTSRNGRGPNGDEWCNPRGRGLGQKPALTPGTAGLDAVLWIKAPGESDGTCNGGPSAGQFWLTNALELVANANFAP